MYKIRIPMSPRVARSGVSLLRRTGPDRDLAVHFHRETSPRENFHKNGVLERTLFDHPPPSPPRSGLLTFAGEMNRRYLLYVFSQTVENPGGRYGES